MSAQDQTRQGTTVFRLPIWQVPIWSAGFRPFFLAGAIYGPLAMVLWLLAHLGVAQTIPNPFADIQWHGHELLVGYGTAVVCGFVITGIPSWAETRAIEGPALAFLFATWLLGRAAMWLAAILPGPIVAAADLAFFPVLAVLITPALLDARKKRYMAILPILAGFFYGNLLFHAGAMLDDQKITTFGLMFFLYTLIVLYSLVGGFLTPIFTEGALHERGWKGFIRFHRGIETLAILSVLAFAGTGLYAESGLVRGMAALAALVIHGLRMARWRSLRVGQIPLVWVMHASYAWFLASLALRALYDFLGWAPSMAWLHAFTVGAFGLMKIGFLTRVTLRHTGRPPQPNVAMVIGFGLMVLAALARLFAAFGIGGAALMGASSILWALPFVIYLWLYGAMLIRPSLPG